MKKKFTHPYIPNSVPEIQEKMLKEIGVNHIEELYKDIPENLRFKERLNLPEPLLPRMRLQKNGARPESTNPMQNPENREILLPLKKATSPRMNSERHRREPGALYHPQHRLHT